MEKLMSDIMAIVSPVLITAVGLITTWGLFELKSYIAMRRVVLKNKTASNSTDNLIRTAVDSVEQTMRKDMSSKGDMTIGEQHQMKREALAIIDRHMTDANKKTMQNNVKDLDGYLDKRIEQTVKEDKGE